MALGAASLRPLAWLGNVAQPFVAFPEFFVWRALTVSLALPGWWRQLLSSQRREVQRVLAELMATRGIMPLLMKARNGETWSPAEKEALLAHLRRMAHLSPYLIALLLPGSVLLLPLYAWWLDRRRLKRQG